MTDKRLIAVDIDQTLHEFRHTVVINALNNFGQKLSASPNEWGDGIYPVTSASAAADLFHSCYSRDGIFLTNPYRGSAEALSNLFNQGFTVEYFTDRPLWAHNDTRDWLKHHGFPNYDGLHCCEDKRFELLSRKEEVLTVFDDRPRTMQFAQMNLGCEHVFSIKHNHNRNLTDMVGMHLRDTWDELIKVFNEIYAKELYSV